MYYFNQFINPEMVNSTVAMLEPACKQWCSESFYKSLGQNFWPEMLLPKSLTLVEYFSEIDPHIKFWVGTAFAIAGTAYFVSYQQDIKVETERGEEKIDNLATLSQENHCTEIVPCKQGTLKQSEHFLIEDTPLRTNNTTSDSVSTDKMDTLILNRCFVMRDGYRTALVKINAAITFLPENFTQDETDDEEDALKVESVEEESFEEESFDKESVAQDNLNQLTDVREELLSSDDKIEQENQAEQALQESKLNLANARQLFKQRIAQVKQKNQAEQAFKDSQLNLAEAKQRFKQHRENVKIHNQCIEMLEKLIPRLEKTLQNVLALQETQALHKINNAFLVPRQIENQPEQAQTFQGKIPLFELKNR